MLFFFILCFKAFSKNKCFQKCRYSVSSGSVRFKTFFVVRFTEGIFPLCPLRHWVFLKMLDSREFHIIKRIPVDLKFYDFIFSFMFPLNILPVQFLWLVHRLYSLHMHL